MANIYDTPELKKLRDAFGTTAKAAEGAATDLLVGMHALEAPTAKQRLTDSYRAQQKDELKGVAQKVLRDHDVTGLLQRATAMLGLRDQVNDPDRVIRDARFFELVPMLNGNQDGDLWETDKHRQQINEVRGVQEELKRLRIREELRDGDDTDLLAAIHDATASATPALLHLVNREVRRRERDKPGSVGVPVKSALLSAKGLVPPPPDVVEKTALLDEIDSLAARTADAQQTILTGKLHDRRAAVERVSELTESGLSPTETAQAFTAEQVAAKETRERQAATRAVKEVQRAIRADEQAAPKLQIPINVNSSAE